MKKLLLTALAVIFLATSVFAAPIYGPKMPKRNKFFMGLQNHTVLRRDLEKDYARMRSLQNFLIVSYGIFDWLSLDLKGGFGNVGLRGTRSQDGDYNGLFAGGYGFRVRLYENEKTKLVFGFQHISVHPDFLTIDGEKKHPVLDDWQWSLLASYNIKKFTPYIGTRWSRMDNIYWVNGNRKREKSDLTKSVGLIAGTDFSINRKTWINIEGQFFDSTAAAASLNYAF